MRPALAWSVTVLMACRGDAHAPPAPPAPTAPAAASAASLAASAPHGSRAGYQAGPTDEGGTGGFAKFKETWVYVDGVQAGVLLPAELPAIPKITIDDVEDVDFKAGQTGPRTRTITTTRYRLVDYLRAIGVDVARITMLYLHGGTGVVPITGAQLRDLGADLTFDFTGSGQQKVRFFLPAALPRKTAYDRYAAVSVLITKPVLAVDDQNNLRQGDATVGGIPYFGEPARGGVRVYLDDRLALVLKRNTLGDAGKLPGTPERWDLAALLTAAGAPPETATTADVVVDGVRQRRFITPGELVVEPVPDKSGLVRLGTTGQPVQSILLYRPGKAPPASGG